MAIISLKLYNKDITQKNLEEEFNKQTGNTATKVENIGDGCLLVFFPCKRVYEVEKNGDVKYIGKEDEIKEIFVIADKESDLNSKQVQAVKINVKKYNADESEKITIQYAWNQSKSDEPKSYKNATLEEGTTISIIESGEQPTGNYYLWVKVKVGNTEEIKRTYGEYYIQEYTTLVNTSKENSAESGFLGNTYIQRGNIKSITLTNSIEGKEVGKDNCWDAGNKKGGVVLAWYTEEYIDENTYYNVTIGQNGKVIANASSTNLFAYIGNNVIGEVTIQGLENLDTSNVISMWSMFSNCNNLINLDVSNFNTSRVTNMYQMFLNCTGLTNLNLSNFDTSKVLNMRDMFSGCERLTELNVSDFNTSNVIDMCGMFYGCKELTELDVSKFDTSNVTNMTNMFVGCEGLTTLDVSNFDTSNVSGMVNMFNGCKLLTELDVSNFNTSKVTSMLQMFYNCEKLTKLDVSNFNTSRVISMYRMFSHCEELQRLDVSKFDTSSVTNMFQMFQSCKELTSLDVSNFDTHSVTNMWGMFQNCEKLTSLDVRKFNTSSVTSMYGMFNNCKELTNLNLDNFNTSKVTDMRGMFQNCEKLTSLDLRNWVINEEMTANYIFSSIPNNCNISVSTQAMKDWVLSKNSKLTNVNIVDENGNIIESNEE